MAVTAPMGDPVDASGPGEPLRLRRSRRSRLSGGHLAMLVAGLLGVVLTLALLRGADERVPVAVAARDLAPGSRLRPSDVRYSPVAMNDELLATTLDRAAVHAVSGQVVVGPIRAGELVTRGRLRPRAAPSGRRAMSVPIDPARAVDGDLAPGDRVDVVLAGQQDVAIVVAGAEVLSVDKGDDGTFASAARQITVTLAVDARESQLLTAALADGDLAITRVTGATSAVGTPPVPVEWAGGGR
ncbi:MAG TPA: Flp pilus assembly protein CpaB [Acidimicrobiia bacterium]|nr:Flp pilus assembly protein CpaB [Acidimicrobiia bacterium]